MPFLLTLNSGQEAEARRYFSPASQPATPLAPQPAPVPVAPCSTRTGWAQTIGTTIGNSLALRRSISATTGGMIITSGGNFSVEEFDNAFNSIISANKDLIACKSELRPIALQAAQTKFMQTIRGMPPQQDFMYSAKR